MNRQLQQFQYNDNMKQYGEITGDMFRLGDEDRGMPYRPTVSVITNRYKLEGEGEGEGEDNNDIGNNYNKYNDFDLYNEQSNIDVLYHDPNSDFMSNFKYSDISEDHKILSNHNSNPMSRIVNEFTFTFLHQFSNNLKNKKSIILSPFNIFEALCLLYIGSNQATEKELRTYFGLPGKKQTFDNLYKINNELIKTNVVSLMNLVCVPYYFNLNTGYTTYISNIGNIMKINPRNASREIQKINGLVSQATNGMVNNLMSSNMITNDTALLLINTIYFYSKWKKPFNTIHTKIEMFNGINKREVYMMSQTNTIHNYYEDKYNQVLEMEYLNNDFVFGIILPRQGYADINITSEQYYYYVSQLKSQEISTLKIPKLKYETRYAIENLFKKYGMRQIFTDADVSDIIPKNDHNTKYWVDKIIHNAIIIVDESGTKAAASTSMSLLTNSIATPKQRIDFIANHQFLYYIRHVASNCIIFIGKYY